MLQAIRSSAMSNNAAISNRGAVPARRPAFVQVGQPAGDLFIRQSHAAKSPNFSGAIKFAGGIKLTEEMVEALVKSNTKDGLMDVAEQAAEDAETKAELIQILLDLHERGYKNNKNIHAANKTYLNSEQLEKNYRGTWRGFWSTSGEDVNWSISPC